MQLPSGGDGPYLIAIAAIYGIVEVSKFVVHKRNGAIPHLMSGVKELSMNITQLVRGQDQLFVKIGEQNRANTATLERIERKVDKE